MSKETRVNKFSSNCSSSSPYPCSSNDPKHVKPNNELGSPEDVKQWEEARCPICLDHPHNAVLLRCCSYENGCRPYICNSSVRHSNCLYQFCKLPESSPSSMRLQEILSASQRTRAGRPLQGLTRAQESELQPQFRCPLCRGEICGWSVVEAARKIMNSKARSCSCETCDFLGNYAVLRKHARSEHPSVRPADADPERQQNWTRLEQRRTLRELFSMSIDDFQNGLEDEENFEDLIDNIEEEIEVTDGIEEEVEVTDGIEEEEVEVLLPREEEEEDPLVSSLFLLHGFVLALTMPTNAFVVSMNTATGEENFRRHNSSSRNVSPDMRGRRDYPRYTTLNSRQNNNVRGNFTERVLRMRGHGRPAALRQRRRARAARQMPMQRRRSSDNNRH